VCSLCTSRTFRTVHAYLLHVRIRHAHDANFRVKCGIHNCKCEYYKYDSLYKHFRRHHCDVFVKAVDIGAAAESSLYEQDSLSGNSDDETVEQVESVDISVLQERHARELHDCIFKHSLKLREKYSLPASTHEDIVADCKSLVTSILTGHNEVINCHLKQRGYDVSSDDALTQNIFDVNRYEQLWLDCDTSYKLMKNCAGVLEMIKPLQHIVGNFKSYYIPLVDTLQMLVQKDDIAHYVLQPFVHNEGRLTSFTSGDAFHSMTLHIKDGRILLIHLYNDEFEVVNPIGAARGKHKLNATYFTLGNLPNRFRSSLQHIHLVNLVKHKAVKAEGYSSVFSPLVQDLQKLYTDGFTVVLPGGKSETFYAVLCTVSGDNLSSHALAGFRQVFNSGRVCRVCMISHDELGEEYKRDMTVRTAMTHAYHVEAVKQNHDNCAIYGVVGPSIFSGLDYFDVTQGFPADVMHDCLESIMPVVASAVVKCMVDKKLTTVSQFNKNLASFPFKGSDRVNKPEPIKTDCSIVGSASQKMCIFWFLPFILNLEPCPVALKLYVLTREVMSYALCRCLSLTDLDYFQQKILAFRHHLNEHFSTIAITPKFHYLVHYPLLMARYGPLRNLWCMRFEGKHQYFKGVAKTTGNFINIAHTLATRHQMLQCYLFSDKEVLGQELKLPSSGKFELFAYLPLDIQRTLCYVDTKIWSVKEATASGCQFVVGAAILADFTSDGDPVFVKISYLLLPHEGHLDILGKLLMPVAFRKSCYAYEVADYGWAHVHPGNEKDCSLFWPYEVNGTVYVAMPYHIPAWSS